MASPIGVYSYNWSLAFHALPVLLQGLWLTCKITLAATLASLAGGLLIGVLRSYGGALAATVAGCYVHIFRSLSPYIYLLWVYFGIAIAFGINLSPFIAAVVSLTLLYTAYFSEIFRAALQAIDRGQIEAALSLGMSRTGTFVSVEFPQAARIALPPLVNSIVVLLKDSSLVAVIGAPDLMYITIGLVESANHPFEFYTVAALLYCVVVVLLSSVARLLEVRLGRAYR